MIPQPITDSTLSREEILKQNPASIAPEEILSAIQILDVTYQGFDGELHQGQIAVHTEVVDEVQGFFAKALEHEFPIEKIIPISAPQYNWDDEISCSDNNSSAYNYRFIHGTTRLSNHARGLAFDINPAQNIYVKYDAEGNETYRSPKDSVYDPSQKGTLTQDHPLVVHMKTLGWIWGGDWTPESGRVDYQHFEKTLSV